MVRTIYLRSVVTLLGRFPALCGVDLDVARGEVLFVQGPNGAGKTTLLRACAGLVPVVEGHAEVLGCDLRADRRAVRGRVGLLGHAGFLYAELTVIENLRFAARAARARAEAAGAAEAALVRLGLTGRLRDVPVARLSAGQRRRAAIAAMVTRQPELWLLDEPYAGLDGAGRLVVDELIAEAAGTGATVVIASHEQSPAFTSHRRAVTMVGGQVRADTAGTTAVIQADGRAPEAAGVA